MELPETYSTVRKAIVAFIPRYRLSPTEDFPDIFGTGFIVDEDGLVVTNDHVVRAFAQVPRLKDSPPDEWPVAALLFHQTDAGMCQIPLEIIGVFEGRPIEVKGWYYGPRTIDLAVVHVKAKGLPCVEVDAKAAPLVEGERVATAGFPMGTDALRAPGYIHQVTPTLQEGVISAVLPFPCSTPHAFMVNIMASTGASGSPIFAPDSPKVIGVLYGGLVDMEAVDVGVVGAGICRFPYVKPTCLSYAVPGHFLETFLRNIYRDRKFETPGDALSLQDIIAANPPPRRPLG